MVHAAVEAGIDDLWTLVDPLLGEIPATEYERLATYDRSVYCSGVPWQAWERTWTVRSPRTDDHREGNSKQP